MTRTYFVNALNEALDALGGGFTYALHSLCMGGAAHLYLMGWSVNQIMEKGRWVNPDVAKRYCESIRLHSR